MNSNIHSLAKNLRINYADAERHLWNHLRARRLDGLKFRRQQPVGRYIVDFVCFEKRIIIEVDGGQHSWEKERDEARDKWLSKEGFRVLRFWNNEVLKNINGVLEVISADCSSHPPLTPPIKGGGKTRGKPIDGGGKTRESSMPKRVSAKSLRLDSEGRSYNKGEKRRGNKG
jgi:very-short-patch-repair endonuclease